MAWWLSLIKAADCNSVVHRFKSCPSLHAGRGATVARLTVTQVLVGSTPIYLPIKNSSRKGEKNMKLMRYQDVIKCEFVMSIYVKTEAQLKAEKARKKALIKAEMGK